MKTNLLRCALFVLLVMVISAPAFANVQTVSPAPSRKTVNADRPISFTIVWRVRGSGVTAPFTLETDDGAFFLGSPSGTFLTNTPAISKTVNTADGGSYETTLTETLTVSRDLIRQALAAKQPLYFQREITDNGFGTSRFAGVTISFAGGIGGNLEVTRLRLSFPGGESICTAEAGAELRANAFLQTEGTGMLRGQWQVRTDPYAASFRTLKNVYTPVNAGKDLTLKSPPLPTDSGSGRVDVRFLLTDPAPQFETPYVTCVIKGADDRMVRTEPEGDFLTVLAPAPYAPLSRGMIVKWEPAGKHKSYRIVFLSEKDGRPVAAQDVPGGYSQAEISPLALVKLDPKRHYLVRILGQ